MSSCQLFDEDDEAALATLGRHGGEIAKTTTVEWEPIVEVLRQRFDFLAKAKTPINLFLLCVRKFPDKTPVQCKI